MHADLAFKQLRRADPKVIALKCPKCGHVSNFRYDTYLIGCHWVSCKNFGECDFSSDAVIALSGKKKEKTNEDFK